MLKVKVSPLRSSGGMSAISHTTLVSLVPTLLKIFASGDRTRCRTQLAQQAPHAIQHHLDRKLSVELCNKNITYIKDMPHGLKPALPESCPAELGFPTQAMTIASMEYLARKGVLYFNLHTRAHSFYGEMRGQIYPAKE